MKIRNIVTQPTGTATFKSTFINIKFVPPQDFDPKKPRTFTVLENRIVRVSNDLQASQGKRPYIKTYIPDNYCPEGSIKVSQDV